MHFYGTVEGSRSQASRSGTKASGINAHIRGWNIGARVSVTHEDGRDVVRVWSTSGSSDMQPDKLIAQFDNINNPTKKEGIPS